jgi:hypothetical protein
MVFLMIIEALVQFCSFYNFLDSFFNHLEFGLPSNIEQRFVPRAPKFYEQPHDQEFGRIDQITLGGGTTFGISKLSIAIVVTLTCRADAYPAADY